MEISSLLEVHKTKFKTPIDILMTPEEINCLAELAREVNPETVVEIGSWCGGSARLFSCFARRVYCIDHWMHDCSTEGIFVPGEFQKLNPRDRFVRFCKNLEGYLHTTIFPCVGPSETWAAVWKVPIDFLFIDGNHTYEGCKADILGFSPHVMPGGVIAGHDYGPFLDANGKGFEFFGVKQAVDEIYPNATIHPGTKIWSVVKE